MQSGSRTRATISTAAVNDGLTEVYQLMADQRMGEARVRVDELLRAAESTENPGLVADVLQATIYVAQREGNFAAAEQDARRLMGLLDTNPAGQAAAWAMLGESLNEQGQFEGAAEAFRQALALNESTGGSAMDRAVWLNHLAIVRGSQGRFAEGEELFRRAVEVATDNNLDEARIVASANLARNLYQQGRHAEAEAGLRQAVEDVRATEGETAINYGIGVANLAIELQAQGRHLEALTGLRQALGVLERSRGRDHADNVLTINALAQSVAAVDGPNAAAGLYREAVDISRATRLPGHPQTTAVTADLAKNLLATGQDSAALGLLRDLADVVHDRASAVTRLNATQAAAEFDRTRSLFRLQVQAAWEAAF